MAVQPQRADKAEIILGELLDLGAAHRAIARDRLIDDIPRQRFVDWRGKRLLRAHPFRMSSTLVPCQPASRLLQ